MASSKPRQRGNLRIIGGTWRGRKLSFTATDGLRPTADRVRETLFNWLGPELPGSHCLDLFAGSGALGLEALSRGAASCLFVEQCASACDNIRQHLATLDCTAGTCQQADALRLLQGGRGNRPPLDIVFLDPPFADGLLLPVCQLLEERGWLADRASIYVESSRRNPAPLMPESWQQHRTKTAGEVHYQLFVRRH